MGFFRRNAKAWYSQFWFRFIVAFVVLRALMGCTGDDFENRPIPDARDTHPCLDCKDAPRQGYFVDQAAPPGGNGSREHPYSDLQATIDYVMQVNVADGVDRQVYVCGGLYSPIVIPSPGQRASGIYITGGWACGEVGWRKNGCTPTVIKGDGFRSAVWVRDIPSNVFLYDVQIWGNIYTGED